MNSAFRKFLFSLLIFTVVISLLLVAGELIFPDIFISPLKWPILAIFLISSTLQHYIMLKPENQQANKTVRIFMAASAIKLMVFLMIIVLLILIFRKQAIMIVVWFLSFYTLFTVFENILLFRHFKRGKTSQGD